MDRREARERLVAPFYMDLLFGGILEMDGPRRTEMVKRMAICALQVSDHDVLALWNSGYREAAMGSWWLAIRQFPELDLDYAEHVRAALDFHCHAKGYTGLLHFVAMVCVATEEAGEVALWARNGRGSRGSVGYAKGAAFLLGVAKSGPADEEEARKVDALFALVDVVRQVRKAASLPPLPSYVRTQHQGTLFDD